MKLKCIVAHGGHSWNEKKKSCLWEKVLLQEVLKSKSQKGNAT
jgi:hypothetical protein